MPATSHNCALSVLIPGFIAVLASVHKYLRISDLCEELALLLKPQAGKVA
jgi:hypothetical protein